MPDIFNYDNTSTGFNNTFSNIDNERVNKAKESRVNFWNKENTQYAEKEADYRDLLERYQVPISQDEYNVIKNVIANAENPEDETYRWASAMQINKQYGMPVQSAYENLEQICAAKWGAEYSFTPKTAFKAIVDSGRQGVNTLKMGKIGSQIMIAESSLSNKAKGAFYADDLEKLYADYEALEKENAGLEDLQDRNAFVEMLKFGGQSLPFTGYVAGASALGSLIAPGVGTAAGFAAGMQNASGLQYMKLRRAGSSVQAATALSLLEGSLESLVENALGNVPAALGKKTLGEAAFNAAKQRITGNVFKRFAYDGTAKKLALRLTTEYLKEAPEEGIEEVVQDFISKGVDALAAELGGYEIDPMTARDVARDAFENFRGGFMGSLALGLGTSALKTKADIKDYFDVRKAAEAIPSKETFKNVTKDNPIFRGLSDEEKSNIQDQAWEKAQARVEAAAEEAEAKKIAEIRDVGEGASQPAVDENGNEIETEASPVVRDEKTGRLFTQVKEDKDENGNVTGGTFLVGNRTQSDKEDNRYGYIKYSQNENGDITIDNFYMKENREGLRQEVFEEFAREHPDVNIEWNTKESEAAGLKEELIKNNPSGAKNGLRYFTSENLADIQTEKELGHAIRDKFSNSKVVRYFDENGQAKITYKKTPLTSAQVASSVALFKTLAQRDGKSLSDFLSDNFVEGIFGNNADLKKDIAAYNQKHVDAQMDENRVTGGFIWKDVEQGTRAVIYAAENADYLTLMHELAHFYQTTLTGKLKEEAEAAFGVKDGNWNALSKWKGDDGEYMTKYEAFAYFFQDYISTGRVKNQTWKNVFDKFAQFLVQAYTRLKNHLTFTPEIENVFENMLGDDKTVMAMALKAAQEEEAEYNAMLKRNAEEKQLQQKAEAEKAEQQAKAEREAASEYTDYGSEKNEQSPEEIESKLDEVTNEKTEDKTNAIDDALKDLPLTDEKKAEIAEVLKDKNTTRVEKAEAATEAASSVYDDVTTPEDNEEKANSILNGEPVHAINSAELNIDVNNLKESGLEYIRNNPQGIAKTNIGDIEINESGVRASLSHTLYKNKVYAIPAIKDVLEKGTYLGVLRDLDGKKQNNYYFAAPITIDGNKQTLFIRVKHVAGRNKLFYIHDVFTDEEIKEAAPYSGEQNANLRSLRGAALAKSIIQDYEKYNKIQNDEMMFQIVGEIGAQNLDDSEVQEGVSRMQNLAIAKQMETDGKDAKAIRLATGWEKGDDGKWKWEIDDRWFAVSEGFLPEFNPSTLTEEENERLEKLSEKLADHFVYGKEPLTDAEMKDYDYLRDEANFFARYYYDFENNKYKTPVELQHILKAPELYKAYPELKFVQFIIEDVNGYGGFYSYKHNRIVLDPHSVNKSNLLHEVQHVIQRIEGFSRGGTAEEFERNEEVSDLTRALSSFADYKKEDIENHIGQKGIEELKALGLTDEQIKEMSPDIEGLGTREEIIERMIKNNGLDDTYREIQEARRLAKAAGKVEVDGKYYGSEFDAYMSIAGEVEARNVQKRMNFTPEERRNTLLAATEDVAPEDKIILFQTIQKDYENAETVDKLLFQTQAELMDEARQFSSWQDFMAYCEQDYDESQPFGNDEAWYKAFWEQAHGIAQEEEKQAEAEERKQEAEADTPEMVDRLFISYIRNNPEVVDNFVQEVAEIAGLDLAGDEWAQVDEEGGRERERYAVLQDYINAELSDGNWQTAIAKVQGGHELSDYIRKRLITEMTDAYKARDFRNLYSAVMKDKKYAVDALDTRAAEIERKLEKYPKRYYDIVAPTEDVAVTTPQRRKQIAQEMKNKDLAVRVKAGTLKLDDEVYNYLKSVEKKEKDLKKQEQQLTEKIQNLYNDVGNIGLQQLIRVHEQLMEQKTRLSNFYKSQQLKVEKGLRMTDRYTRQTQEMTQTYHELERKFSDLKDSLIITEDVQKILDTQERRREIREEAKWLAKDMYLAEETKKIRINLVKQLFKKVDLAKVDFKQAQQIIAIQKLTMPNMIGGVNRWIGRKSPFLNAVLSRIVTDSEYKKDILNYLEHVEKKNDTFNDFVESIRNAKSREDFEHWGVAEREYAIKYLPKENWVWDLKLKEKARELQESLNIEITQEKVERLVYDADGHPVEDDEGGLLTEEAYKLRVGDEALNKLLQETLGDELYNRLLNSPMVEWSTQEMEELVSRVNQLRDEGITMRAAKLEARKREAQKFIQQVADAIKDTGIVINDDDPPEVVEKKLKEINKVLGKNKNLKGTEAGKDSGFMASLNRILHGYKDANILRVGRIMDNQSEGVNVYLLYRKEDICYNAKMRSIMNRGEVVHKVMAANKITEGELAKSVKVAELGTEFTNDELLFFLAADKDFKLDENGKNDNYAATSRNAVCFGNMMSDTASQELKEGWDKLDKEMNEAIEKDTLTPEQRQLLADNQLDTRPGTTAYINECNRRWDIVIKKANELLNEKPGYKALLEAIQADYADQYERMNEVSINEFNVGVNRVKCYVPLVRREQNGAPNENQVMEDLLAINGVGKGGVNKGMTQSRQTISPLHQRPVQTGLFRTWCDSVERTEHFIAYAPYVRLLNRVYKSNDAQYLRRTIEGRYGKGMLEYIDAYINEVANPNAQNTRSSGAELLHILRGKTAPAYLGWKASAIIKQGLTSPWPYMQFVNPAEYLKAAFKCNNPKMWEAIQEKSVFMKNRRMDPMNDLVDEMAKNAKNKADKFWSNFTKKGMEGLEWIDWVCVAPGWYACYEKKYNQLQNASEARYNAKMAELEERNRSGNGEVLNPTQMETIAKQELLEDIEMEAVTYADDCTRQCQPSNRLTDLAPWFKDKNEFMRAFLQFQTSLNVIWQNLRYDMPYAAKQKEYGRMVGTICGYVLAGVFMNSVMEGVTSGADGDDDKDKQALRNLIFYATTQFTDAVPMIGSEFTNMNDQWITGKRGFMNSGTDMTPTASKLISAFTTATKGNWEKAATLTAEGIGLFMGAPVSGVKEINKLLGKPLTNGDVDLLRGLSDVYGIAGDILEE